MRLISTLLFAFLFSLELLTAQVYTVAPNFAATTWAGGTFLGPLSNGTRRYQLLINENQLTALVGKNLSALSFRLGTGATQPWPASDVTYSDYTINVSTGVSPANRSLTFANNIVGTQTLVRSGALVIPAGTYSSGGNPNSFGPEISFGTTYLYSGGHLLVEILHSTSNISTSVEAALTSSSGYATDYSACWSSSLTSATGAQGNFSTVRFTGVQGPIPVRFISMRAVLGNNGTALAWKAAGLENTSKFVVERSIDAVNFKAAGNVPVQSLAQEASFEFLDTDVTSLSAPVFYYRLKQEEVSGRFSYSGVVRVKRGNRGNEIFVFPNPVHDVVNISISAERAERVQYRIINMQGQHTGLSGIYNVQSGINIFNSDVSSLKAGTYVIVLESGTGRRTLSLVKE